MRIGKTLKRGAVFHLTRIFITTLNMVPQKAAQAIGAWVGLAAWSLLPRDRYQTTRHLKLVFGDQIGSRERALIGREFFINSGKNLAEVVRFARHFEEIKSRVSVEGIEHFHAGFAEGKGIIGVTGHIGNFELLAAYLASYGYPTAVIARELHDSRLEHLLRENRYATNLTVLPTTSSPREILRWLKQNGGLGVLIDTDSSRVRGDFIPMFGRPANTPVGPAILGLRAGSCFLPMACVRTEGNRYRVIIRPAITIEPSGDVSRDACAVTEACVRELERIIEANKSQWIWLHNRWHTRVEDSA